MNHILPYEPKWSRNWTETKLKKRYFKKPYDRFMWWRSYTPKNKPLTNRHPLRDRIANGDFEQGPYLLEIELVYHTMNDKFKAAITPKGEVDHSLYHSNTSVDRARKKRLSEDHEKEEFRKLDDLRTEFLKEFKMSREEYDVEVINTSKSTLDFYFEMEDKYGKWAIKPKRVPKF
jgi:hypothetical protein